MGEDSVLGFHLVGILAFSLSTQIFFFLATLVLSGFDPLVSVSQEKWYYLGENQIRTPDKKPKNGELTENQIKENKVLSSRRIFVEHLIRVVKVFKVVQERFRLKKSRYKSVLLTVCGLVRLRISALILEVIEWE